MRMPRSILPALSVIVVLACVAQAAPRSGEGAAATVAWIGDGAERDGGPATPGPTDPNGPVG